MYPELTMPLLVVLGIAAVVLTWLVVTQRVLRRLAFRQITRRRTEAVLVVAGSMLGTAIIVGALVVGDTLGFSVRQEAYNTLGPIDERVVSSSASVGQSSAELLQKSLAGAPGFDGVLTARVIQAAGLNTTSTTPIAEPRVLAWDLDMVAAQSFGASGGPSGLSGPAPRQGQVVVNAPLATSLKARVGDRITLFVGGRPLSLVVSRIVPARGLAGTGFGATQNRDAFLPQGTLSGTSARTVTWVSNAGGVEAGNKTTAQAVSQIRTALGPLATLVAVETPKHDVLLAADKAGASLGALFLMIGSFSIIAGALLLVNIFVMLAEERKAELGMLRAAGLKRSRLVGAFTVEGSVYAIAACVLGAALGILVGRGVAFVAAQIFGSWSVDGSGLDVTFSVTGTSLVNGIALGLVISILTIVATSIRISRFNIIAAIRDLEVAPAERSRRRLLIVATSLAVLFGLMSVQAIAASQAVGTFLWPALTALCLTPLLTRQLGKRVAYTVVSSAILAWTLLANVVRPRVYDTPSMAVYVVMGSLLAFSAVILISENQTLLLRPLHRFLERPTERGLARRLGMAYPLAKRFRTGATLIMYTLIVLVLVLLVEIGGVLNQSIDSQVASATAGYGVRIDFNPDLGRSDNPIALLPNSTYKKAVTAIAPLTSAAARSVDPGHRSNQPVDTIVVGVPGVSVYSMQFTKRMDGLDTDAAVWAAVASHPDYVVLDANFGATGGPAGEFFKPGDRFAVTDLRSGRSEVKTIAGILTNGLSFYSPVRPSSFPLITNEDAVYRQFGTAATVSSALLAVAPDVRPADLSNELQATYLSSSLVATPMAATVRRLFDANLAFFQLMEGFLALGLLVGITGLGVVMVRAVRERRRTIGILRALGFRSRTIERAFLIESGFVAFEGVVLGSLLGILTTWLMYQKSAAFSGIHTGYPVMWGTAAVLGVVTLVASLVATLGPARRAARILPALATRVAD